MAMHPHTTYTHTYITWGINRGSSNSNSKSRTRGRGVAGLSREPVALAETIAFC